MTDRDSDLIVGIDLGTTFSLIAYADERGPHVIRDENGEARLPSVISFLKSADGQSTVAVGWDARNHAIENASATVYSIKRLIGKSIDEIRNELPFLTYRPDAGPRGAVQVRINGRAYSPEHISSVILRALKERAERYLNRPIRKAVITVPAYFDDAQRQATRAAAAAADLEAIRIINEPTAAALAYGIGVRGAPDRNDAAAADSPQPMSLPQPRCHEQPAQSPPKPAVKPETVAVFDLGGGTFDISILRIENGAFQVLAAGGDTHLGGDDFDRKIIELVTSEVRAQFDLEIESPATRQALRSVAEAVKVRLSSAESAALELDLGSSRHFRRTITRAEFDQSVGPLVQRALRICSDAVRQAGLSNSDLDQVILVGGSTRMPVIRRAVEAHFGRPPYTALNPDEVIALGAAVQGSIIAGRRRDLLLLDVIPLSLGIETLGGAMGKLIMRNSTIPCRATEMFSTFVDGQTAIKIRVLQGERELAEHCRTLAEFELRGIPPMPAGIPKLEVEFLVDANGILNVAARELRSGVQTTAQVVPNHGLTEAEIEQIAAESIVFARDDIAGHRRIDLLNQVDFDIRKTRQTIDRLANDLGAAERADLETAIAGLQELAKTTSDLNLLHQALTDFGRRTLPLAEKGIRAALQQSGKKSSA